MRILICGSRSWTNIAPIAEVMQRLPPKSVILHGAAIGADTIAHACAEALGFEIKEYPVTKKDWDTIGRKAGMLRNRQMLFEGCPQLVIAFLDDTCPSPGTRHMIDLAEAHGTRTLVIKKTMVENLCTACYQPRTSCECQDEESLPDIPCCPTCTYEAGRLTVPCEQHKVEDPQKEA